MPRTPDTASTFPSSHGVRHVTPHGWELGELGVQQDPIKFEGGM